MWWSKNLFFLPCLFLTSCGLHPLYMPQNETSDVSYPLKIATISDRRGQILRNYLVDLLTPGGTASAPLYVLEITLTDVIATIGVNKDETTSRKQATLTAVITLRDAKTYAPVYTHSVKAINSFAILSQNYYADLVAEDYAKNEALRLLAEKIKLHLATYLDAHGCGRP